MHTHTIGLIRTCRERGRGEERELNTSSGSLVKRATGLAPHQLICESLSLNSSVPLCTHCAGTGGAALSPICTLINLQKHLLNAGRIDSIYMWNSRGHQCVWQGPHRGPLWSCKSLAAHGGTIITSPVQLLLLPIALVMMERNTLLTLLALSTQSAYLKSGLY